MNKLSIKIVVLFLSSLFFFSCGKKDRGGRTDTRTSGEISFYADESFSPIIEELKKQFEFQFPNAKLNPIYSNENEGFKQIKDLKTCLFFTSRALKPSEVAYLKSKRQLPEVFPIAYDGLALIVNSSNNDTCMTVKDVKRILSGEVTNWNQIVKGSKRGEIEVVFDNKESATLHYVVDSLLDGKPINSPNIVASKTSKEVVDYVDQTPNAIGVIGSNWLNDRRDTTNTTFKKNIHVMSISLTDEATPRNSWKPYQAYLLDGRYPFVRTIYAILVDPQRALPYSFANYVTNPKGQLIVFKSGLLPFRGDIIIKDVKVKK
ncbi:MAG: substrate-binding domain-containing protein [Prevotella sp.]|jgi:phosphate transport system substrate-binding protein|nr:substrate-binding domain-containing protein [Prevotella sp.]MBQ1587832.1 substrate-binding domain-containing protein [Prevotella sp.]MBQ1627108.1 substrate-binding domain-containing protein [Prevotella sp.]MBQ1646844.1 substrate-binding domain-containing protein [Prevotella sp.]MBQ1700971.1 substrate-binding domain-containing protein [Prevotella sp.]